MGFMWLIGERLRERRKNAKLDASAVARALDISKSYLSMLETGNSKPNWELLRDLSKMYDVSADYILGITNDPSPTAAWRTWSPQAVAAAQLIDAASENKRTEMMAVLQIMADHDYTNENSRSTTEPAVQEGVANLISRFDDQTQRVLGSLVQMHVRDTESISISDLRRLLDAIE